MLTVRQRINRGATRVGIALGALISLIVFLSCLPSWDVYSQPVADLSPEQEALFWGNIYRAFEQYSNEELRSALMKGNIPPALIEVAKKRNLLIDVKDPKIIAQLNVLFAGSPTNSNQHHDSRLTPNIFNQFDDQQFFEGVAPEIKYRKWPDFIGRPFYRLAAPEVQRAYIKLYYQVAVRSLYQYSTEWDFFTFAKVRESIKMNYNYLLLESGKAALRAFLTFASIFLIIKIATITAIWVISGFMKE